MTIWKVPLAIEDRQIIYLPGGAEFLSVQVQRGTICAWAQVDPENAKMAYTIRIHGTGHPITTAPGWFLGTVQLDGGALVFHVFYKTGISA